MEEIYGGCIIVYDVNAIDIIGERNAGGIATWIQSNGVNFSIVLSS